MVKHETLGYRLEWFYCRVGYGKFYRWTYPATVFKEDRYYMYDDVIAVLKGISPWDRDEYAVVPLRTSDPGGARRGNDVVVPLKSGDGGGAKKDSSQKAIVPLRSSDPGGVAKAADPRPLTVTTAAAGAKSGTQTGSPDNNKTQLPSDVPVKKEQP